MQATRVFFEETRKSDTAGERRKHICVHETIYTKYADG